MHGPLNVKLVSFILHPPHPQWKSSQYPLIRKLGGPQSRSWQFRDEVIFYPFRQSKNDSSDIQARHCIDYAAGLHL